VSGTQGSVTAASETLEQPDIPFGRAHSNREAIAIRVKAEAGDVRIARDVQGCRANLV